MKVRWGGLKLRRELSARAREKEWRTVEDIVRVIETRI